MKMCDFINFLRITIKAVVLSFAGVIFRVIYDQIIGEKSVQIESLIGLFIGFFIGIFLISYFTDYRKRNKNNK
ncbi:hypothetical protein J7E64_08935 [Priestia megaterium]|nr:hypothetical protein [Priestia megaterium]